MIACRVSCGRVNVTQTHPTPGPAPVIPYCGTRAGPAGAGARHPQDARSTRLVIAAVLCTALAGVTCVRIEILNARAGGVLPRDELGKWRVTGGTVAQQIWRFHESVARGDPTLRSRNLTRTEDREMRRHVQRAEAEADLRDVVRSWGLLQYLIVPAGLVAAHVLMWGRATRRERLIGLACSVVLLCCAASALGRSYYTSLGW